MDPRDWDLVEQFPNRYLTMAPKRDLEAEDGKQLTLGDTTRAAQIMLERTA
jgi:hypothetical protein